ncbi:MAG: hypothetical protein ACOYNC_15555 [Bacteroidales bacterium]
MKKLLIYMSMLLLLLTVSATYGQSNEEAPRRTPAEQAAFEKSLLLNPANAGPLVDPKMEPDQVLHESPTNWKAAPVADEDNIEAEVNKPEHSKVVSLPVTPGKDQSEGGKPLGKTDNRRDLKGSGTQPEPPVSGAVTNRRNLKGPGTQPEGKKPNR